ncbi:MAG: hypothetical protein F4Y71_02815 [Acidobacteria bacterium]|nr:hypothetical protein [Acidobacteriota bacterium]MYG76452.1 hypothetical protein [Acidobacteriota bacterium]
MNRNIQIRNVPPATHRRLKVRAAAEGFTMSSYLLRMITTHLERPSRQEVLDRIRTRPIFEPDVDFAEIIREGRESR